LDPYRGLGNGARVAVSDISRARHPGVVRGIEEAQRV